MKYIKNIKSKPHLLCLIIKKGTKKMHLFGVQLFECIYIIPTSLFQFCGNIITSDLQQQNKKYS